MIRKKFVLFCLLAPFCMTVAGMKRVGWGQAAAKPEVNCVVDKELPSDAEKALSRRDYKLALDLFQKLETSSPQVAKAGGIRTLLQEGKLQDASEQAKRWEIAEPESGAAMETWGEVLYRRGEFPDALKVVLESRKLEPCSPRALLMLARIEDLLGDHATAVRQVRAAHMLAPQNIEVEDEWLSTLRPSERRAKLATEVKDESLLNAEDRKDILQRLAHEKDYSKGDCQVIQSVENPEFHIEEMMEDANHRKSFGLYVKLNGSQRTLEIDTGASGITLSRGAASRLGLVQDGAFTVEGIGDAGGIQSTVAHVASVRFGGMEFKNCPVTILEKKDKMGIDGLIGMDFFRKYLVTLDFPGRKLRLSALPKAPWQSDDESATKDEDSVPVFHDRYIAPEMKDWTMVWRSGHLLLLPVSIGGARDKLVVIDTGAASMLIAPSAAREVTKVHGDFDTHIVGLSGEVEHVYQTQAFLMTFGHIQLHVDSMTAVDSSRMSKDEGFEISGFMGAPVLNRLMLQIDYRDNLVNFKYDAKKDPENLAPMPFY